MKKPSIHKVGKYWRLEIPAIAYVGGWYDWTNCMIGLELYYQNKYDLQEGFGDLDRLINAFIMSHTCDGYYLSDWNHKR